MRIWSIVVGIYCAALLAPCHTARAEDAEFPYTAYANSDDVYIRSGPGKNYYPTEKLSRGEAVEIFRHDPGGWYAVRPPHASFSWIPARLLQPTSQGLATVVGDRVVSRVGSRFSDIRDVIQVRLDKGEEVEIIEVKTLLSAGQSEQWCKIAPPAGEFRWVFGKFVDRDPAAGDRLVPEDRQSGVANTQRDSRKNFVTQTAAGGKNRYYSEDVDGGSVDGGSADDDPSPARIATTRRDRPANKRTGDADVSLTAGADGRDNRADRDKASNRIAAKPTATSQADTFQAELDSIDLALSSMVVEESSVWRFEDLHRRSDAALERAQTALERGKARLLLDRITKFEDIQRRSDTVNRVETETDRKNGPLVTMADSRTVGGLAEVEGRDRFDASGKLIPVKSSRPGAPPFAIVNRDHEVVAYVTPAPGVSLQSFVAHQVGVSGQRGYMPEFAKPHITAQRVTVLDATEAVANRRDPVRR